MATNYSQPLLNNDHNSTKIIIQHDTKKFIILLFLSIVAFFSLGYYIYSLFIYYSSLNSTNNFSLCEKSLDPSTCLAMISQSNGQYSFSKILEQHVLDVKRAMREVNKEKTKLNVNYYNNLQSGPLGDCLYLMSISLDRLSLVMKTLVKPYKLNPSHDLNTWLSAILSNHLTCLDQLEKGGYFFGGSLRSTLERLVSRARAILSIQVKLVGGSNEFQNLLETFGDTSLYPSWVKNREKKLLEGSGSDQIKVDVVVAKNGSGNFTTVWQAVMTAPNDSESRYVIHVKAGVYEENVEVPLYKKNLMIVGDGMNDTIITSNLYNNKTKYITTFNSATLGVSGDGFILQDISIINTAGPYNGQAVALRISSDKTIINRCKLDSYQDTLYSHTCRQFYKDTIITGTVDFIFGDSSSVFQTCKIIPRKPGKLGTSNMITAHGRDNPCQHTGYSFQFCEIVPSEDLAPVRAKFPSFLGRPWREYARVMVMQTYIDDVIDPKGWSPWNQSDYALKTLYYGEYNNSGLGSDTSHRVNWTSFHVVTDPEEARPFTVKELIQGDQWINYSFVSFDQGL